MLHSQVSTLAYRIAARSIRHVNGRVSIRTITTSLDGRQEKNSSQVKGRPLDSRWIRPRQCIVDTKHPAHTAKVDVLMRLNRHFRPSRGVWRDWLKRPSSDTSRFDEAIVILATPNFARWLQDETTFIPKVLNTIVRYDEHIERKITQQEGRRPEFTIDVVCACVDGLPPRPDWIVSREVRYRREGFAILHGRADQIVPGLWGDGATRQQTGAVVSSSLTFSSYQEPSSVVPFTEITLPLANTIFATGEDSKVFVSKWRFIKDNQYEKIMSEEKNHQTINVFGGKEKGFPPGYIPVIPLTPVRRIASGLGNIVRQLDFDGGVAGPASRELEECINEYLSMIKHKEERAEVLALITPSESMPNPPTAVPLETFTDAKAIRSFWKEGGNDSRLIGNWLQRGATLCSVVSGGGGWGPTLGLLSLDPQLTHDTADQEPFVDPFANPFASEDDQPSFMVGGVVKPNSYIQFFLSADEKRFKINEPLPTERKLTPGGVYSFTAVGAVPSDTRKFRAPTKAWVANKTIEGKNLTHARPGHFGAVSESGIFLRSAEVKDGKMAGEESVEQTPILSKVNAPFSYFYRDMRSAEEKERDEPMLVRRYYAGRPTRLIRKVGIHTLEAPE